MKQFTITIPENKESIFIELMKSLSFVKNVEAITDVEIAETHQKLVMTRFDKVRKHPERLLDWEKARKTLKG